MRVKSFSAFTLNESAVAASGALALGTVGLVSREWTRNSRKKHTLCLYDFDAGRVLGYFEMYKPMGDEEWVVNRVYGEKGYGPLMYDCAMSVTGEWLVPSKTIRPGALSVWKYMRDLRSDVVSEALPPEHPQYSDKFAYDDSQEGSAVELDYIDRRYRLKKPVAAVTDLLQRGKALSDKAGLKPGDLMKDGEDAFMKRYKSEHVENGRVEADVAK